MTEPEDNLMYAIIFLVVGIVVSGIVYLMGFSNGGFDVSNIPDTE